MPAAARRAVPNGSSPVEPNVNVRWFADGEQAAAVAEERHHRPMQGASGQHVVDRSITLFVE